MSLVLFRIATTVAIIVLAVAVVRVSDDSDRLCDEILSFVEDSATRAAERLPTIQYYKDNPEELATALDENYESTRRFADLCN